MSTPTTKLAPVAGAFSLAPASLAEAIKFAELIAKSDLAPTGYKGKPENVLIAVQMGLEIGLSPMAAIQGIAVIGGRPSLYGDALLAVVRASGKLAAMAESISGEGAAMAASCCVTRAGEQPITRTFTVADAKTAGLWGKSGPWSTSPARMLQMRARAFALRDGFADVLRGMASAEESEDIQAPSVVVVSEPQRLEAGADATQPADVTPADTAPAPEVQRSRTSKIGVFSDALIAGIERHDNGEIKITARQSDGTERAFYTRSDERGLEASKLADENRSCAIEWRAARRQVDGEAVDVIVAIVPDAGEDAAS